MGPFDSALRRVGIEPGERALFGWAGLCFVLLGATAFALLNASETLFLKRVGVVYLPWVLLASSGLLVITTGLVSHALAEANRLRWLPRVLLGLALLLLPLRWLLHAWEVPAVFGTFVLVARQVLSLGLLVVWLALGDLVTGRQAKRLFAPLGAGVTLGAIIGSFASDPIARWLSTEGLVLVGALLLCGAAAVASRLHAARPRWLERGPGATRRARREAARGERRSSAAALWRESLLFRLLLAALLCGGLLSPVLYFEFSYVADAATTGPDAEQRLLALYAQFRGWLNVAMLFTQLWLSGRLYQRVGLPLSLALWPASYLLGFGWLGVGPGLAAGVSALGATRLSEDGIGGSALRVLFNLFPERLRATAAGLLEGPVNRIGGVLGNGSVLLALALGAAPAIAYAALPVAAFWLLAVLSLWRAYPSLLLQASAEQSLVGVGADKAKLLDAGTVRALAGGLADPDPRTCRAALDLVTDAEPALAAEVLAETLERVPAANRALVVDALYRLVEPLPAGSLPSGRAAESLAQLLAEPERLAPEERADLLQTYARLSSEAAGSEARASTAVLERALGDREPAVRLAAIAELHRRRRPPPGVADLDAVLRESLAAGDVLMRRSARKELRAMLLSTQPDEHWRSRLGLLAERLAQRADRADTAEALVEVARRHDGAALSCADQMVRWSGDRDPRVRAAVLRFTGYAGAVDHVRRLLAGIRSRHAEEQAAAREGLVALGAEAAQPLLAEYEFGDPARRDAAMSLLRDLELDAVTLDSLYQRQLEAVRNTVILRAALSPEQPASLLLRRLEERVAEDLGALLALLSLVEEDDRIAELERRLRRAPDERSRDVLIEALEALIPGEARAELVPLLEAGSWQQRGRRCAEQLQRSMPSQGAAWSELLLDRDPLTRRLAQACAPEAVEERAGIGDPLGVLDPMDVAVMLKDAPAFDRLSTQQLVSLAEVLEHLRYEAGEVIFDEGDEGDGLYFVLEGEVDISQGDALLDHVGPGTFFGELSTLDGVPRSASARARQPTRLLRLEREELLALMESSPALGIGLSQFLSLRVRKLQERVSSR